jgi:hypothetical protein
MYDHLNHEEIETRARKLRADYTRAAVKAAAGWVKARFAAPARGAKHPA